MKARHLAVLVLSTLCALPGVAPGQDTGGQSGAAGMGDLDVAMQQWQQYMMPGPPHKELEFFAGDWTLVNHADMGGQETTSEGTAHAELMMGGRYLHAVHRGEMFGMPFEGVGITGYDNVKKQFFNVWFDNMGTGAMVSYGDRNEDGDIEVKGTYPDPMMGDVDYRMVTSITGKDTYTYDMYMNTPEGEKRVMHILYTRAKP